MRDPVLLGRHHRRAERAAKVGLGARRRSRVARCRGGRIIPGTSGSDWHELGDRHGAVEGEKDQFYTFFRFWCNLLFSTYLDEDGGGLLEGAVVVGC